MEKAEGVSTSKSVELIASGYEWICPGCEIYNQEIEITGTVKCRECGEEFVVSDHEHAYGSTRNPFGR
ncbi:MAG: hypothetical protein P8074_25550 [Anaerolineales bacterium]|jgi:hypothetical protein